eukprot:g3072.t1
MLDSSSAILSVPHLTKGQLGSDAYLRKEVRRLNKQADRDRRRKASELRRNIRKAEMHLVQQKSLVPPSQSLTAPRVKAAERQVQEARDDLVAFHNEQSTQGYKRQIALARNDAHRQYQKSCSVILTDWRGPVPPERNVNSSWSRDLGGEIDTTSIRIRCVKHNRDWDKTPHTRGLRRPPKFDKQNPFPPAITMMTPERERLARSAYPVDSSPSVFHASENYINHHGIKRTKSKLLREAGFRIGKMCGDRISMCAVDHPKHGMPFHYQQRTRTLLDRNIERLEAELKKFPKCGLTINAGKPKAAIEQALGELKQIRKAITGARAEKLTQRVAKAKKNLKTKLKMLSGLKSKGFGDLSFLKAIQSEVDAQTTPRPAL